MPDESEESYYPPWLAGDLLADSIPWDRAVQTTLSAFFADYTLHDSSWIGLTLDPVYDGGATAIIRWDTIWTDGRVPFPGSRVAEWPILLIRFAGVSRVEQAGYDRMPDAPSRGIDAATTTEDAVSDETPARHRTVIEDHFGGALTLVHAPTVKLLCLARDRTVLAIPGVGGV